MPHLTFWFSIPKPPTTSPVDYLERFANMFNLLQTGATMNSDELAGKLSSMLGIKYERARSFIDTDGDKSIRATFARALSNALGEANKRHIGGGTFDFTDSKGASAFAEKLQGLIVGNASVAKVKRLIVDVVSASVSVEVDLTSKHQLSKKDIAKQLDAMWKEKDKQESALFNDALDKIKASCDKVAQTCQSLPQQFKTSQVCGSVQGFETVALAPLSPPVTPPDSEPPTKSERQLLREKHAYIDNLDIDNQILAWAFINHPNDIYSNSPRSEVNKNEFDAMVRLLKKGMIARGGSACLADTDICSVKYYLTDKGIVYVVRKKLVHQE